MNTVSPPEPYYPPASVLALAAAQLDGLRDRAHRLEIERDQRSKLAAATERTRMAREMHDILGHNLSVMITLADAGARLIHMADNPDTYSDRDIRDAIGRIAGAERSHPSIAYALQQYQAVLEEDRRIERAKRML